MVSASIFLGGLVATFACIPVFFTMFMMRGAKYKELIDPDHPRLALGEPFSTLFTERLLSHEAL